MEYRVIVAQSNTLLAKEVNQYLMIGWELYGSLCHGKTDTGYRSYMQAMIRKTPNTAEDLQDDTQHTQPVIKTLSWIIGNWYEMDDNVKYERVRDLKQRLERQAGA